MKLRVLAGVILFAGLIGALAFLGRRGDLSREWAAVTGSAPVLDCPRQLDLGERQLGEQVTTRLTIANRGGGELHITDVRTNCSCSGLEKEEGGQFFRVDQVKLGPGQEASFSLRVAVNGRPGEAMRNVISFRSNDPTRPEGRIEAIVSTVRGGVITQPSGVLFGTVLAGDSARQVLQVRDGAVQRRTLLRAEARTNVPLSVRVLPRQEGKELPDEAVIGRVEVVLEAGKPGLVDGSLQLVFAGAETSPLSIPVSGRIAAPVEVLPALVVLPRASGGGPVYSADCLCRSVEGKDLLLEVTLAPPGVRAEVAAVEGNPSVRKLAIHLDPRSGELGPASIRREVVLMARTAGRETRLEVLVEYRPKGGS